MSSPDSPPDRAGWALHIGVFLVGCLLCYLAATLVAHLIASPSGFREAQVRSTGGLLQLFGIVAVVFGIRGIRRMFGLPPIRSEFGSEIRAAMTNLWVRAQRIFGKRLDVHGVGVGVMSAGGSAGHGFVRVTPGPDATLQQRVELMEQRVDDLEALTRKTDAALRREVADRTEADAAERRARVANEVGVTAQLRDLALGGIPMQVVGICWVLVGLLLTTWPQEIARTFCRPA